MFRDDSLFPAPRHYLRLIPFLISMYVQYRLLLDSSVLFFALKKQRFASSWQVGTNVSHDWVFVHVHCELWTLFLFHLWVPSYTIFSSHRSTCHPRLPFSSVTPGACANNHPDWMGIIMSNLWSCCSSKLSGQKFEFPKSNNSSMPCTRTFWRNIPRTFLPNEQRFAGFSSKKIKTSQSFHDAA